MPIVSRKMPSFSGVAAGQSATCRLPIGLTYHQLLLTYSGVTLAQLNEIRVIANGQMIQRYVEASKLDSINQFSGRAAANGVLVIDQDRHAQLTRAGVELTALGTGLPRGPNVDAGQDPNPITTLSLEVDIDAGAAAPVLSLTALQSLARPAGIIKKVREYTYNAAATGEFEISDLPKGDIINRVVFASADVDAVKVERNNLVVFNRTSAENNVVQADGHRVPQAGYFVFDPTEQGYGAEGLVTAGAHDLRFVLTMGDTGAVPVTVEYLGQLEI